MNSEDAETESTNLWVSSVQLRAGHQATLDCSEVPSELVQAFVEAVAVAVAAVAAVAALAAAVAAGVVEVESGHVAERNAVGSEPVEVASFPAVAVLKTSARGVHASLQSAASFPAAAAVGAALVLSAAAEAVPWGSAAARFSVPPNPSLVSFPPSLDFVSPSVPSVAA